MGAVEPNMSAVPNGKNKRAWKGYLNDKTIAFASLAPEGSNAELTGRGPVPMGPRSG